MSASTYLFDLIQSLSKNEKRYFKLFCSLQKGEKNYLKLFDYLDSMLEHDEEKIINRFAKEDFVRNVHVTKNYLYNLILKSLRSYYADKSIQIRLANLWVDIELLERRGLYQQAWSRLQKTRKIAAKFQDYLLVLKVCEKELSYVAERVTKKLMIQQDEIINNVHYYLNLIEHEFSTLVDYYQLSTLYRQHNNNAILLKEKIDARAINSKEDELIEDKAFTVQYLSYYIKALLNRINGNHATSHEYLAKVIDVWKTYFYMIDEKSKVYKIHLSNYLTSCHFIGKYDGFKNNLEELKKLTKKSFDEEAETFQNVVHHELMYRLNTLDFEGVEQQVAEIEKGLLKYQHKINKARETVIYFNLALVFFLKKEFELALDWLNRILQDHKNEHRKDVQRSAHILQLIFHLELGNVRLLENLQQSTYRKLKRWAALTNFEMTVFDAIKAWCLAFGSKEKEQVLKNFEKKLVEMKHEKDFQIPIIWEELILWLSERNN